MRESFEPKSGKDILSTMSGNCQLLQYDELQPHQENAKNCQPKSGKDKERCYNVTALQLRGKSFLTLTIERRKLLFEV